LNQLHKKSVHLRWPETSTEPGSVIQSFYFASVPNAGKIEEGKVDGGAIFRHETLPIWSIKYASSLFLVIPGDIMLSRRMNAVTFLLVIIAWSVSALLSQSSSAQLQQSGSSLPKRSYYQAFSFYRDGNFQRAGREFQQGYNTAYQEGDARYVDSICFLTMMGECHFHMGNYADALTNYEQALKLYLSFVKSGWQARIDPPKVLPADAGAFVRSRVNWGTPTRTAQIPKMPATFMVLMGRVDASRVIQEGGAWDPARLRPVDVTEVMRCVALSMHRRRNLLGAMNRLDPLSKQLLAGLRLRGAGDGSIMGAYNGVVLGIALASMERFEEAARMLTGSLQISGQFDHPLTPVALTELTRLAMANGKTSTAATLALEASYSAGVFNQYDLVNESLSLGTTNHLTTLKTPYPPLANAIQWANRERFRLTQLSLIQRLAESHAESGNIVAARETIALANTADRRRNTLSKSVANSRLQYTSAVASFTEGNFAAGLSDLSGALQQYQNGSLWLYRLRLASDLVASKAVSELDADKLFGSLLHDPTDAEWKFDPIEPMSFLATDHVTAMETWFDILVRRRQYERALQVSELIRRHRFYSTLPLGGRLMAFRHSLNAETKALDPATARQRESFLNRNGGYRELLTGALTIQKELVKLPLAPKPDSEDARKRRQLLAQLAQVSSSQEALMASYALSREPSNLAFPPQLPLESFKRLIPKGTLTLSTLKTFSGYHLFFVSRERIRYVNLGSSRGLESAITKLLRSIGAIGGAGTDAKYLAEEQWKEPATKIKQGIFTDIPDDSFQNIVELVVIPDGMLWYMPFELLPMEVDGEEKFLVDLCPIRYAPTAYLSVESPGGGQLQRTSVALASMHPRGELELTLAELEELKKKIPDVDSFEKQKTPSGLSAWLTDHLMIWSNSFLPANGYDFRPIPFEVSDHASINSWMSLPWYGPEFLSLPGLQTFGKGRKANGSEMFLTTVTLMSAGSRTIMLPRWPTGGATSLGLTRLYAEHLTEPMSGAKALRKAMIEARDLKFEIEKEPQIKKEKDPGDISLKHPFFWASFFVVDQPRLKPAAVVPPNQMPGATLLPGATSPTPSGGAAPMAPTPAGTSATPDSTPADKKTPGAEPEKPTPEDEAVPKPKVVPKKPGGVF
jgi:tetratricopeptide (TPR) repeat protein